MNPVADYFAAMQRRIDQPVETSTSAITWAASTTAGLDNANTSSSSYQWQAAAISVSKPIRLTQLLWDLKDATSYELWIASDADPATAFRQLWSGAVASGETTITLPEAMLIVPGGTVYLYMKRTAGAATWWQNNSLGGAYVCDDFRLALWYNTTLAPNAPPVQLVYQVGTV